ncbi:unnamed protein product [Toxocara canis]|uniref:Peptidase A2 domain-containing protein n=1 Tax=Toxocara canis TaxID=6265 RepID=A0A183ULG3_TOXCA|nr:unnamed protein product [Toxocara canis]
MYSKALMAMLDVQEERQQRTLKAMLDTANQQEEVLQDKTSHDCKLAGHKRGFCEKFAEKERRTSRKKKCRTAKNAVVTASSGTDVALVNCTYRNVQINGTSIQMRLDTGADDTLLNVKD